MVFDGLLTAKMKNFSITELTGIVKASFVEAATAGCEFTGVSTDSRMVMPGDCFFALTGENFDGHDYVSEAFVKGAVCAVVERDIEDLTIAGRCVLRVRDTIEALGDFAREYRRQSDFKVAAITGSVGKTTTKQIAAHVLGRFFRVHCSPKNFNNTIGVPLTLLGAPQDAEVVIAELGSNHPGEIAYLTRIARPDIAVVTNVYPAHLEGFGDLQAIVREKLSIAEGLGPDGVLIINADFDSLVDSCRSGGQKFLTFGKSDGSDFHIRDICSDGLVSRFSIDGTEVFLPLPGPGNVENALAAWAICSRFGLEVSDFARAVKTLTGVSMRTEPLQVGTLTILNDCYNANPASMKNALQILAGMDSTGQRRKVFICGEMAELGEKAQELHAELGPFIAGAGVELMLAVGQLAKVAAETARASGRGQLQIKCFEDTPSACNKLHEFVRDYDIILVKGSRTAALERAVGKLKELFIEEPVSPG
jgi:UDP-N-acetylmuramoyl-tripeptide--D-alanyl-D-alanine ligase